MVTAAQRYAQGLGGILQQKKQKLAYQQAEQAYYQTEEGKKYLEQQQRLEGIRKAVEKIKQERKINVSDYESRGYTVEEQDGTIVLKAPKQRYKSYSAGKNSEYSTYIPEIITIKEGMVVSREQYEPVKQGKSGKSRTIKTSHKVQYEGEADKTETYYKDGDFFRTAEFKQGQYVGGEQAEAKHYGNKYWEAAQDIKKGNLTEEQIENLPDDIKKSGYVKDLLNQPTKDSQGATKIYKGEIVGGKGFEPKSPYVMANILGGTYKVGRSLYEKLEKEGINMPKEVSVISNEQSSMQTPTYAAGSKEAKEGKIFIDTTKPYNVIGAIKPYGEAGMVTYPQPIKSEKKSLWSQANEFVASKTTQKILKPYEDVLGEQAKYELKPTGFMGTIRTWEKEHPVIIPLPSILGGNIDLFSSNRYQGTTEEEVKKELKSGFWGGARERFYTNIREKPLTYATIMVVSGGLGLASPFATATKTGSVIFKGITGVLGTTWLGTKGYQLYNAPTVEEKGKIFSSSILETYSAMAGYGTGSRYGKSIKAGLDIRKTGTIKSKGGISGVQKTQKGKIVTTTNTAAQQKYTVKVGDKTYEVGAYQQRTSFTNPKKTTISFGKSKYLVDGKPSKVITFSASASRPYNRVQYGIGMSKSNGKLNLFSFRGKSSKYYTYYDPLGTVQVKQPTRLSGFIQRVLGSKKTEVVIQQIVTQKKGDITLLKGNIEGVQTGNLNKLFGKPKINIPSLGKKGQIALTKVVTRPPKTTRITPDYTPLFRQADVLSVVKAAYIKGMPSTGMLLGLPIVSGELDKSTKTINEIKKIQREKIDVLRSTINILESKQQPLISNISAVSQVSGTKQTQMQQVQQLQQQQQLQETQSTTKLDFLNITEPIVIEEFLTPPPIIPTFGDSDTRKSITTGTDKAGYNAYVKRKLLKQSKGKYKSRGYYKVNDKPMTKEGALVKAAEIVDEFANRSFQIRKAKGLAKERYKDHLWDTLKTRFRGSKKNPDTFVEKSAFAISTEMEKRQIPYEAIKQRKEQQIMFLKGRINQAKKQAFQLGIMQKKAGVNKQIEGLFLVKTKKKQKKNKTIKFI